MANARCECCPRRRDQALGDVRLTTIRSRIFGNVGAQNGSSMTDTASEKTGAKGAETRRAAPVSGNPELHVPTQRSILLPQRTFDLRAASRMMQERGILDPLLRCKKAGSVCTIWVRLRPGH